MVDGSSDKCWREIEGGAVTNVGGRWEEVVVRFIDEDGKIEEHAVDVVEAHDRSAQGRVWQASVYRWMELCRNATLVRV